MKGPAKNLEIAEAILHG